MESNIPFRTLFEERLLPLMARNGRHMQLNDNVGNVYEYAYNPQSTRFPVWQNGQQLAELGAQPLFYHMARIINSQSSTHKHLHASQTTASRGWLCVDNEQWMDLSQIDAHFPELECGGDRVFKSWRTGCECAY